MVSPAEEKRQEEKRIKELRDFQRASPANRRCFDCNEMSISMSKFTESEVKTMIKLGGNDAAQKYWRAKHDPSFRPQGGTDGERTRNFIRLTYIDRKWVYESPRASKKDDPPQKTASATSKSRNASFTTSNDDAFFGSSSSKKKAAAAPAFDAFGNDSSSASGGGFAQFGDFSNFSNDSSAKASNNAFGDFGHFDQPSSTTSSASGFGDFGDFEGSSGSSAPAAATSAPAVRHDFSSFKLAPPPGASFSSSSSSVAAPVATTPAVQQKKPQNDFIAFSPDKEVKDPFGFDDPPASNTSSHSASTPFGTFAAPAPPPSTGSRASSSSLGAFGNTSAPAPATPSVFDAFGSPVKKTNSSSVFDAFGASFSSTATSSALDVFGASTASTASFDAFGATPAATASPFDAFGGSSTGAASNGGFGDFSSATPARSSSGTLPSTSVSDPFSAFNPRASSGGSLIPEPVKPEPAAAADPFAAFDGMDVAPTTSGPSATSSGVFGASTTNVFGASGTQSTPGNGFPGSSGPGFGGSGQQTAAGNDPFAFAGNSGSKNNSFSNTSGAPGFQGQGAGVMGMNPYQQHYLQQGAGAPNGNPMYPNMYMQQQVPHQQSFQQPQQQQQWYGQPQQHQPAQQYPQHPGQFAHSATPNNGGVPPPVSVHAKPAADASSINDPFASLNIGLSSSGSGSANNSRGNSFTQKPGSASGSFSNGQPPHGAATTSPFQPQQHAFRGGFPPAVQGGSRGNSFEQTSAFSTPMQKNASSMSSFSYPQPQAAFGGP
ncbi:hypothetical protein FI667_g1373, partial [Globisporangium splendens]